MLLIYFKTSKSTKFIALHCKHGTDKKCFESCNVFILPGGAAGPGYGGLGIGSYPGETDLITYVLFNTQHTHFSKIIQKKKNPENNRKQKTVLF